MNTSRRDEIPVRRTYILTDPSTMKQELFRSGKEVAEYLGVAYQTVLNFSNSGLKLRGKWVDTTDKEVYYLREGK